VRLTAADAAGAGLDEDHLHIDVTGAVHTVEIPMGELAELQASPEWKVMETTLTMPDGVAIYRVDLFAWRLQGALLIDDVVIEKIK
jgi:hypothetical protein